MKKKVVVFDFDKTLTEKDTLYGFYKAAAGSVWFFKLKYVILIVFALMYKFGIISNTRLKKIGIYLYLKGVSKYNIKEIGEKYAKSIKLNYIYDEVFPEYTNDNVYVVSASFEDYLKPIFPHIPVAGSKLLFDSQDKVKGIELNMFGENKRRYLNSLGIKKIDLLYTDSITDKPLMDMASQIHLVKDNKLQTID